jgi:hypothetical protein
MVLSKNFHFGGEEMDALVGLGIFLACLGGFFIGCGFIWGVSGWVKNQEKK